MNSRNNNVIQYFITFRMEVIVGRGVTRRRHLIFANKKQLEILKTCHRWYVDGTFKLVRKPHFQLWSIHGFICKNGLMKQVIISVIILVPFYSNQILITLGAFTLRFHG
jgi:hypothetical protein